MNAFRKKAFVALVVAAALIWTYDLGLIVAPRVRTKKESVKGDVEVAKTTVPAPSRYRADFPDPFVSSSLTAPPPKPGKKKVVKPKPKPVVRLPECSIGGIVYSKSNPMATLRYGGKSRLIRQGDMVDSMHIIQIGRDTVRVEYRGKTFALAK